MRKFVILAVLCLSLLCASIFLIIWLPKSDLEKYIIMHNTNYSEKWNYKYANYNKEDQTLSIKFEKKSGAWNENIDNIYEIYKWLTVKVFETDNLKSYSFNIDFICNGEYFSIRNVSTDLNRLEIWCNTVVELDKISDKFSKAKKLYLFPAYYKDITEIEGFNNLQYVCFSQAITDDEIATIQSYFPDCKFECNYSM